MSCKTETDCSPQGMALTIRAHIRNPVTGDAMVQADVDTVVVKVYDAGREVFSASSAASDVFFDTLQTGGGWNFSSGFNFRYVVPGTAFRIGKRTYLVRVIITDVDGNVVKHEWTHPVTGGSVEAITLRRGEAYESAISNDLRIEAAHMSFGSAMTSDGTDVYLRLKRRHSSDTAVSIVGTVESVDDKTATLSFDITSAITGALIPGDNAYRFDVEVVLQGDSSLVVTPVIDGQVNVRADI